LAISGAQDGEAQRGAVTIQTEKISDYLRDFKEKEIKLGLNEITINDRIIILKLLHKRGADLCQPESVFRVIDHAKKIDHKTGELLDEEWSDGSKNNAAKAYLSFCNTKPFLITIPEGLNFKKWSKRSQKLPWIPLEREVDELIAGCSRKVGAFLQLLKETGARPGEAWRLRWMTDVDLERAIVTYNDPEKGSNPRQFKVSSKCIAMLNMLPRRSEFVFGGKDLNTFRNIFKKQSKRLAHKLQNPNLLRITFKTLRHFYGTMEHAKTRNLLYVQERLGHKSILSTMVYTHLVKFESDEYHTATASTIQEFRALLEAGYEYVKDMDGVMVCRKRK